MARAKRTQRADARRRYRQTAGMDPEGVEIDDVDAPTAAPGGSSARRAAPVAGRPLGFTDAMRAAWHRPDIRADIAALPSLVVTRWFLIPLALVLVGIVGVMALPTNYVTGLFFQLMVLPPAMAPVFIVGFFAKRASYLLGLIISVIDVIGYAAFVVIVLPTLATSPLAGQKQGELILSAVTVGPLSGIFFAAGAAWYRRFLSLSSAQRSRPKSNQQRPKASKAARG